MALPYEVLKYLGVPFWKTFSFTKNLRKACDKRANDIVIFTEWLEVLSVLKNKQHILGIISSNSRKTIESSLKKYSVYELFDFITCETPLFGKAKSLKKIIEHLHLNTDDTYYIGDEVRDIEASKKNNIHAIAVAWGFNSVDRLKLAKPDLIITHRNKLKTLL